MEQVKISLTQERTTKGAVLYKEDGGTLAVGSFYLRKDALNGKPAPQRIVLTIEEA